MSDTSSGLRGGHRTRDSAYLLDDCDVLEFNDFVPLGGSRPGAGALETQMTEETKEIQSTILYTDRVIDWTGN